jgi:tetratricopeptide (TPR) repeat protein
MSVYKKKRITRFGIHYGLALACTAMLTITPAWSHGDINEKIQRLNQKIQQEPNNPDWYFQRGMNWLLNQHFDHAQEDFAVVRKLAPEHPHVALYVGRSLLGENKPQAARLEFDKALSLAANDTQQQTEVLRWRAQAFADMNDAGHAAEDWLAAAQRSPNPQPDWYALAAKALRNDKRPQEALAALERGITHLGDILLLQDAAMEIEVQLKRYDAALARVEKQLETAERRDRWWVRKGDILLAAEKTQAAKQAYQQAQQLFSALPEHVRSRPASQQEQQILQHKLAAFP